jgi:hypothetical protein
MITGMELNFCIELLFEGRKCKTRTRDLIDALHLAGRDCGKRLKSLSSRDPWPQRAIIKEIFGPIGKRKSHWVLLWDGHFYDPDPHDSPGTKYSSYLEIVATKEEK